MPLPDTTAEYTTALIADLNPQQQQAVMHPINEGLHVIAGAGTGKTTVIARRYAHLFNQLHQAGRYNPEHHLLTVTFTVKAAEEMKHRIAKQLQSDTPNLSNASTQPSRASTITTEHLNTEGWITHFHGLGHRLLRQHGEHIGLPRSFRVLDSAEREQRYNVLIDTLSNPTNNPSLTQDISTALTRAGLLNIIAPDSLNIQTLKTTFTTLATHDLFKALPPLIERIKSAGLSPKEFFDTAHTQNTTLNNALDYFPLHASDGSSFDGNQTLAEVWDHHLNNWRDKSYSIKGHDLGADEKMLKKQLAWLNSDWKVMVNGVECHPLPRKVRTNVVDGDSRAWENLKKMWPADNALIPVVSTFYALYQYQLHQQGACDFDDLILRTLELFDTHPTILAQYQDQFQHIIVDEFQDTNDSQLKLIQRLLGSHQEGKVRSHVTVVGDEKQSIYGFRYAQPENLNTLANYCPQVTSLQLGTNYRSTATILNVINQYTTTILNLPNQTLSSGEKTSERALSSTVEWITLCDLPEPDEKTGEPATNPPLKSESTDKKPPAPQKSGKPSLTVYQDAEARWITQRIATLLSEKQYPAQDIAILVPTHTKGQRLYEQLINAGIPAQTEKGFSLLTHPTAMNIQAWMLWLQNPHNTEALVRLLQTRFTDGQLYTLCQQRGPRGLTQLSLFSVIQSEEGQQIIQQWNPADQHDLHLLLDAHTHTRHTLKSEPLIDTIETSATELGLLSSSNPVDSHAGSGFLRWVQHHIARERRYLTLSQVNQRINQWQRLSSPVIEPTKANETTPNDDKGAVRILTIHAAKGLEFPVVFVSAVSKNDYHSPISGLVGFEPQFAHKPGFGVFLAKNPLIDGTSHNTHSFKKRLSDTLWNRPRHTSESKRLFYVALTRAKEKLMVTRHTDAPSWTNIQEFTETVTCQQPYQQPTTQQETNVSHHLVPLHQVPVMTPENNALAPAIQPPACNVSVNNTENPLTQTPCPITHHTVTPSSRPFTLAEQTTAARCPVEYQLKYVWNMSPNNTYPNNMYKAPENQLELVNRTDLEETLSTLQSSQKLVDKPSFVQCDTIACGYHHLCPLKSTTP